MSSPPAASGAITRTISASSTGAGAGGIELSGGGILFKVSDQLLGNHCSSSVTVALTCGPCDGFVPPRVSCLFLLAVVLPHTVSGLLLTLCSWSGLSRLCCVVRPLSHLHHAAAHDALLGITAQRVQV